MRQLTLVLFVLFSAAALTAQAQENKTPEKVQAAPETTTDTEKPKNEVDRIIADAHKRGETVLAVCIDPAKCGEGSEQILNLERGRAVDLPIPAYPAIARAAHAQGAVLVQLIIDEEGKVIAAAAVQGHPLLQASCVRAARGAAFTPTKLAGKPVKVTGVITYNFVVQ